MKVFGGYLTGRNMPHFMGGNGHFSIKTKLISISVYILFVDNFTIYCQKIYAFFGRQKLLKN